MLQLVNYVNWSLGTLMGARMNLPKQTHTHTRNWLHVNSKKIRPVEKGNRLEVFPVNDGNLANQINKKPHMEPIHLNQHD